MGKIARPNIIYLTLCSTQRVRMRVMLLSNWSGGDDLGYCRTQQMGIRQPTQRSESEQGCTRGAGGQHRLRHCFLLRCLPIYYLQLK